VSHSVIDDFGLGSNSQTDIFPEEQVLPVRKVSNIGGAGVQLLKKANQEASDSAPKKIITIQTGRTDLSGAAESDITSRLKKREHTNVDLETLIRQGKE